MSVFTHPGSKVDLSALAVLAVLFEGDRHPYEISRVIKTRHQEEPGGHSLRSLYHAVERLTAAGLIEVAETSREGHRPERTVYRITAEGREEFRHTLSDLLMNPRLGRLAFTAALSRLGYMSESEAVMSLEIRLASLEGMVASHRATLRSLRERVGLPRLFLLETEYVIVQLISESGWLASTIDEIKSGALAVDPRWHQQVGGAAPDLGPTNPDEMPLAVRQWAPGGLISEGPDQAASDAAQTNTHNSQPEIGGTE
jgi:DNA-binding PadR family transcriptional regulator